MRVRGVSSPFPLAILRRVLSDGRMLTHIQMSWLRRSIARSLAALISRPTLSPWRRVLIWR